MNEVFTYTITKLGLDVKMQEVSVEGKIIEDKLVVSIGNESISSQDVQNDALHVTFYDHEVKGTLSEDFLNMKIIETIEVRRKPSIPLIIALGW